MRAMTPLKRSVLCQIATSRSGCEITELIWDRWMTMTFDEVMASVMALINEGSVLVDTKTMRLHLG